MKLPAAILLFSLLPLVSCAPGDNQQAPTYEIEQHYESGPFELTVKVSRAEITVAGRIELALEAVAAEGQEVEFPRLGEEVGEFRLIDAGAAAPRLLEGDRLLTRTSYQLEPFLPGDYEIPPMKVRFGEDTVIETRPITVRVVSVLPASDETPDIKEIVPPVELPGLEPWVYWAMAGLLALAAGGYFFWRRRRLRQHFEPPLLPHQIALRELRKLQGDDLILKGQAKLFYLRLSLILRRYIEDRFGLRAPESTTEEFLADLGADPTFVPRQKELLKQFLEHCDMVKFAEHSPTRDEIDQAINTCAQFIAETRGEPARQAVEGGQ